jgi:NDP-sugar pyrophosphorylase family protein
MMRVMILAAGLGTRLRPLSNTKPKALVEVGGRPMIEYSFDLMERYGVREVIVNIHHFAPMMRSFLEGARKRWNLDIQIQDESSKLLGSGGGVALAKKWLYEKKSSALFWNPDGLVFPDLNQLSDFHAVAVARGNLATINLLRHPEVGNRYHPVYYQDGQVLGFGRASSASLGEALHFAGAYILEKSAADLLPPAGEESDLAKRVWFPLVAQKKFAAQIYEGLYQDLGTPEDIEQAEARLARGEFASVI